MVEAQEEDHPQYTFEDEEEAEQEKKEEIDYSKWKTATKEEVDEEFGILKGELRIAYIPVSSEKKTVIKLYLKELSVDEVAKITDMVTTYDKEGNVRPNMSVTLTTLWHQVVERTEPPLTWAKAKHYKDKFLALLLDHISLPELKKALTEDQEKN